MAAVVVLLAAAVTGLQARGTFARGQNQALIGVSGSAAAVILSAAEGLAVIAFLIMLASARPQRKPKRDEDDEPWRPAIPWWAKTLGVLLAVAALVTPFAVLFTRKPRSLGHRGRPGRRRRRVPRRTALQTGPEAGPGTGPGAGPGAGPGTGPGAGPGTGPGAGLRRRCPVTPRRWPPSSRAG